MVKAEILVPCLGYSDHAVSNLSIQGVGLCAFVNLKGWTQLVDPPECPEWADVVIWSCRPAHLHSGTWAHVSFWMLNLSRLLNSSQYTEAIGATCFCCEFEVVVQEERVASFVV